MQSLKPMAPMAPMQPLDFGQPWWPEPLGRPGASGAQGDVRYAFFPDARRLVVERAGRLATYDTGDHRISAMSQQGGAAAPRFTSQRGDVTLDQLAQVD